MHRAKAGLHFRQAGKNSTLIVAAIPPGLRYAPVRIHSGGQCQTRKKEKKQILLELFLIIYFSIVNAHFMFAVLFSSIFFRFNQLLFSLIDNCSFIS